MRRTNRVLAVAIIVTLLVPGFVVGALVEACCGVDVTNLQVSDSPDPVCADGTVTISGTYATFSPWGPWTELYDTGIEIKVFDAGTEIASYAATLGVDQPDPGDYPPGTEWSFSWDWTPSDPCKTYDYEVIAWSDTGYGRMEISFVGGTITTEYCDAECLADTCMEYEIRGLWAAECPTCDEAKNHGQYVSCRADIQNEYLMAGLITEEESSCLIHPEAMSDCGFK